MIRLLESAGILISSFVLISACKVNKNNTASNSNSLQEITITTPARPVKKSPYRAAETRLLDVQHMDLAVRFDYEKQHLYGKAVLNCKPYFYALKIAELDARGFDIRRVALLSGEDTLQLKYEYNGSKLLVSLNNTYNRTQSFTLYIDYVSKPNELKNTRGIAITDDKGLYFINPVGKDKDKPRQVWTQGETQSNSCWFPTVDAPNEKITHDIAITVDDKDITLSNGELMMSKMNADGSRTDYWKQNKPHAPYLVMMAVGEFAQVKDYWRDSIAVDYYVEPKYKPYAKMVFGNTPEMLEVFSKKLGVDYAWNKYAQIVVRDFVSGAMENTSAVIHYDALQHDEREHLDNPHEDIIAHELFHHWFGDLVTCESWSNLPLNESFATYGEYIWQEHKYGSMEADKEFYNNLRAYLGQKNKHKVEPVRYHYHSRDDLFDVVSYQKGGYILHMLRRQVGDEAFFAALKLYLTRHAHKTAEMADLRMAFEEVTGQDLNWFFDQWFLKAGHPVLEYSYAYSADRKKCTVTIAQKQDSSWSTYRLPLQVDVYTNGKATRETIEVKDRTQSFEFTSASAIDFINVDADQALLASVSDLKTPAELMAAIRTAPLYMDKHYAASRWGGMLTDTLSDADVSTINYLLTHEFWGIRDLGLQVFGKLDSAQKSLFNGAIKSIALSDSKSANRAEAVLLLAEADAKNNKAVFEQTINDSAYSVVAASLEALSGINIETARPFIDRYKTVSNRTVQYTLANLLADDASTDEVAFYEGILGKYGRYNFGMLSAYVKYLQLASKPVQQKAIPGLKDYYRNADQQIKQVMPSFVKNLQGQWKDRVSELEEEKKKSKKNPEAIAKLDQKIAEAQQMIAAYENILE